RGVGRARREEGAIGGQIDEDDRLAARQVDAEAAAAGADGGGVEDVQDLADEVAGRRDRGGCRRGKKRDDHEGEEAKGRGPHARPNVLLNRSSTWRRWCWTSKQRSISWAERREVMFLSLRRRDLKSPWPACASMAAFCTHP